MTRRLTTVLTGGRPAGVYRWLARAHPEAVRRELSAAGWATHPLDGRGLTSASQLFDRCARMFAFPGRFRHTWDGLTDCLTDLSWLPEHGHVVLWDHYHVLAHADPKAWRLAYQAFADAIAARERSGGVALYLLLRGPGPVEHPAGPGNIPLL
ncbi:MAG TPA: barstar family protein [Pilimelia sp.]|nr:barstar family protein [Pilimelia sp.]